MSEPRTQNIIADKLVRSKLKAETKETRDQGPETKDQKPKTRDQKPKTKDQKPETRTQNPEPANTYHSKSQ